MVPCCISSEVYQLLDTISKVWMNRLTHSCHGYSCQTMRWCSICFPRSVIPIYFLSEQMISSPNMISFSLLHYGHSEIDCLCVPHHLAGVSFNTWSKAYNRCDYVSFSSNYSKKDARLGNPSYVGSTLASAPTLRTILVILAHLRMETSCNLFYQFSRASSESDVHEITLCQLSFPSVVGLI